jgi:hypothetical protein
MAAAKTTAERVTAVRARRAASGLVRLELWVHPDDREPIKAHASRVRRKREKGGKAPPASG